jgi:hypothetical protein
MEEAVIRPGVNPKTVMLRGTRLANIFINPAFASYDYLTSSIG